MLLVYLVHLHKKKLLSKSLKANNGGGFRGF